MTSVYFVDFVGKKLLDKKLIDESPEEIPDLPDQTTLDKLGYFAELAGNGLTFIKFNAMHDGVDVPDSLKSANSTVSFSHTFKTKDLKYDELGVSQTLSFRGREELVKIPWEAVNYIGLSHGGDARSWAADEPPKVIKFAHTQNDKPDEPEPPPPIAAA